MVARPRDFFSTHKVIEYYIPLNKVHSTLNMFGENVFGNIKWRSDKRFLLHTQGN